MIDYLLRYPTEAEAAAAPLLARWCTDGEWDASCAIPGVAVFRRLGTEQITDPISGLVREREVRQPLDGWFLVLALGERDATLEADAACVLAADRETRRVLLTITTAEDLATLGVEPTFAGSDYPFGAPVLEESE